MSKICIGSFILLLIVLQFWYGKRFSTIFFLSLKEEEALDQSPTELSFSSSTATTESSSAATTTTMAQPRKSLVIVMGTLRGGPVAWQTLQEHVLQVNDADLALAIPEGTTVHSLLQKEARYLWQFREYEDWADALDDAFPDSEWRKHLLYENNHTNFIHNGVLGAAAGLRGSGAITLLYRHWIAQKLQTEGLLERYHWFVVTRSDHFYKCAHRLAALHPDHIWVPEGEDWGGITDRHVVANRQHILPVLNIIEPLIRHAQTYRDVEDNVEEFLWRRWKEQEIAQHVRRFRRVMFTCQAEGDQTRWNTQHVGRLVEHGQVRLKYENEYHAAHCHCVVQAPDFDLVDDGNVCCGLGQFITPQKTCQRLAPKEDAPPSLVIVMGNLPSNNDNRRVHDAVWESFHTNVLNANNADLALAIPKGTLINDDDSAVWRNRSKYQWELFPEYEDWGVAVDEVFGATHPNWRTVLIPPADLAADEDDVLHNNTYLLCRRGVLGGVAGCGAGTNAKTLLYQHAIGQKIQQLGLLERYERFVVTRANHYYECPVEWHLWDPHKIWIPQGLQEELEGGGGGWDDGFLVAGKAHILPLLNGMTHVLDHAAGMYQTIGAVASNGAELFRNPPTFFQRRLGKMDLYLRVRRFARVMYVWRDDDDDNHGEEVPPPLPRVPHGADAARCQCSGGTFTHSDTVAGICLCPNGGASDSSSCHDA